MSASPTSTVSERTVFTKNEPSMQEILLSIRHTITREPHAPVDAPDTNASLPAEPEQDDIDDIDDVLELTDIALEDDYTMPSSFLTEAKKHRPLFFPATEPPHPELSQDTLRQTGSSLQQLMQAIRDKQSSTPPAGLTSKSTTVEELVTESIKPALIEWMDQHLPALVERIVEREIKAIIEKHVTTVI